MKRPLASALAAVAAVSVLPAGAGDFPRPPELEPDVRFWTRVYTEIDTNSGFLHDARDLSIVYETLRFAPTSSQQARSRQVATAKGHYAALLRKLTDQRRGLTREESRVLELWPADVEAGRLTQAGTDLRFQLGQADRFREGVIRAGAWIPHIRAALEDAGLPQELAALPHVESSFNPAAWSHVGAAGLWQFTRSTGRRYLRIDHVVDERLDPFASTLAAVQLLRHNYEVTGTWPLALTAYNHGAAGVRRAVRRHGTSDILPIVRQYRGRTFGFASRNFYVAFLAALDVEREAEGYFGPLQREPAIEYDTVELPDFMPVTVIERVFGIDRAALMSSNPALMASVWSGDKHVPRDHALRLPRGHLSRPASQLLARVSASDRFSEQTPDLFHKVVRGETLSAIAGRYEARISELVAMNGLGNRHRIRAGQILRLPASGRAADRALAAAPPTDGIYIVRAGDTFSSIAARFELTEHELLAWNPMRSKHRIGVGQRLRVAVAAGEPVDIASGEAAVAEAAPAISADGAAERVAEVVAVTAEEPDLQESEIMALESAEPTSGEEAAELGSQVLAGIHPALSADPADYSVAGDATIEVQAAETLGHYAEWLDLRASRLRRINGMSFGRPVVIGGRLRLDFSRVAPEVFEERRKAFQRAVQEQFFASHRIYDTRIHVVRRGESLWVLAQRHYGVPVWLLRQYNPDIDLHAVRPGTRLVIPELSRLAAADKPSGPVRRASSEADSTTGT
ncbi:hypothetical protein BH24PSE2_BH24PSE2_09120 [soil metagenome]